MKRRRKVSPHWLSGVISHVVVEGMTATRPYMVESRTFIFKTKEGGLLMETEENWLEVRQKLGKENDTEIKKG